jgi:hypothetical protein
MVTVSAPDVSEVIGAVGGIEAETQLIRIRQTIIIRVGRRGYP